MRKQQSLNSVVKKFNEKLNEQFAFFNHNIDRELSKKVKWLSADLIEFPEDKMFETNDPVKQMAVV